MTQGWTPYHYEDYSFNQNIDFIDYVRHRVVDFNESWDWKIADQKGKGKSTTALALAMRLDPNFSVDRNVAFTVEQWFEKSTTLPRGSVIVGDELGTQKFGSSHKWQSADNQDFADIIQTGRTDGHINIFTTLDDMRMTNRVRDTFKVSVIPERKLSNFETGGRGLGIQCILRVTNPDIFGTNGGRDYLVYPRYAPGGTVKRFVLYHPPEEVFRRYALLRNELKNQIKEDMNRRRDDRLYKKEQVEQKRQTPDYNDDFNGKLLSDILSSKRRR